MAMSLIQMKARFQDPMRQGIVDLLWQSSRVMSLMNFITQKGLTYPYSARAKLPGVGFRGLNEDYSPTAGVVNPNVERLAILGGSIRTDAVIIDTKGDSARTNEIAAQMEAAGKFFDKCFFNGDPATNPKAFQGLKGRIKSNQLLKQATNGATVTFDKVIALQDAVEGPNNKKTLLMNQSNRRNLISNAASDNRGKLFVEFDAASGTYRFNGSPIVEVYYDETETAILDFSETCGTSSLCSSIYCVAFGGAIDERGVQGLSGLTGNIQHRGPIQYGTYTEDVVEMAAGIGLFSGYCAARLQGLLAS